MEIQIFNNYQELSEAIADYMYSLLKAKPNATFVLTSGNTPLLAYKILCQKAQAADFENAMLIGLDEWIGIPPENEGSCRYLVETNLLKPLGISTTNFTFFDALSSDLESECKRIDDLIFSRGGLDFIVVGLGLNGHIGLNEPGCSFDSYCHISDLDSMTMQVGQKYFSTPTQLKNGITIGLKHLKEAKTAMLIANGENKAEIVKKMYDSELTESLPATIFKMHKNGLVWIDKKAAGLIQI